MCMIITFMGLVKEPRFLDLYLLRYNGIYILQCNYTVFLKEFIIHCIPHEYDRLTWGFPLFFELYL